MAGLATPSETRSVNGNSSDVFLSLRNVSKRYGGVAALENVSFDVRRSETHAVMGENGAGKSTLVKILAGAVQRDAGQIVLGGRETEISSPAEAHRLGISIVYQETMLAENLTVAENIFLGHDDFRFLLPARTLEAKTAQVLDRLGVSVRPSDSVAGLTVGQKQLVQIGGMK
ncbi:MAG: ATP-binding cassette domain-containing protein [Planctomycetes bacterium]|nr:ATP-binding cassette domain-containing protein [Planctomycetota bacterium]